MHRRTLMLRRFGPMSFGLGYFEEGVWVDHSTANGVDLLSDQGERRPREEPMDAVHQWFTCCGEQVTDGAASTTHPRIAVVSEGPTGEASVLGGPVAWEAPATRVRASQR